MKDRCQGSAAPAARTPDTTKAANGEFGTGPVGRRELLLRGSAGAAALALPLPFIKRASAQDTTEIVFSFAEDESGAIQQMIDGFNQEHQNIQVSWRKMPEQTDDYRSTLESDFQVNSNEIDVIGADVIWTAQFAYNGWIRDLSSRFYDNFRASEFLDAAATSTSWSNRIWAVPWYTDAGLLFYRKDLLEQAGISAPPQTWDELKAQAMQITGNNGPQHGFVFQGGQYEGGVTNMMEYIWSAGGRVLTGNLSVASQFGQVIMDPNVVTIDSAASVSGLNIARTMVAEGIAPQEVTEFNERDAIDVFASGDAVFMRNWPFAYGIIGSEGGAVGVDQIGITKIPSTQADRRSYSCQGGWNLMINRQSEKLDAAWQFIQYATSAQTQKMLALQGSFLPTLLSLYDDQEILQNVPVVQLAKDVIPLARARPASPFYPSISRRLATTFNRVLSGELEAQEAVKRLDNELKQVLRASR